MSVFQDFPVLYAIAKTGKTKQWKIYVENVCGQIFIVNEYGYVDGKQAQTRRLIEEGKNVGKANETTPEQQAVLEAQSKFTKQVKAGYTEDPNTSEKKILPMLAMDYDKIKNAKYLKTRMYGQPKLDGIRLLAYMVDGEVKLMSRTGHEMVAEHISGAILPYFAGRETWYFDGEVYSEDFTFQEITSLFRTEDKTEEQLETYKRVHYHIFDFFDTADPEVSFEERYTKLCGMRFAGCLTHVKCVEIDSSNKDVLDVYHNEQVDQGYEGIILRDPASKYYIATRSQALIKYKTFVDAEFEIIDGVSGTGVEQGCVIWRVKNADGKEFSVRPMGSHDKRKEHLLSKQKYIGKMITIKYQNLTTDGIPRFPVGKAIRDYE